MKRLGMWNRLAIVAAILFSLIYPTWDFLKKSEAANRLQTLGHEACMKNENYVPVDGKTQFDHCWDFWHVSMAPVQPNWNDWWPLAGISLFLSLIVYLLIRLAVAIAKWIWRGRSAGQSSGTDRA